MIFIIVATSTHCLPFAYNWYPPAMIEKDNGQLILIGIRLFPVGIASVRIVIS